MGLVMFKNAVVFRFTKPLGFGLADVERRLGDMVYKAPDKYQSSAAGFESPLQVAGKSDAPLVVAVDGRWLISLRSAVRRPKAAEIRARVEEKVADIVESESRQVFRRERETIKDEVIRDLLPNTFPEISVQRAYITPRTGLLIVEASGLNSAERFCSLLREAFEGLPLQVVSVLQDVSRHMALWLTNSDSLPKELEIGDSADLTHKAGSGAVTFRNEDPTGQEAVSLLQSRYKAKSLSLCTNDDLPGFSFVLTDELVFKSIKPDSAFNEQSHYEGEEDDFAAFKAAELDAQLVLFAGVFDRVFNVLIDALGGYDSGQEPVTWVPGESV